MQRESNQWFIPALLAVGAAAALWYYWARVSTPVPPPIEPRQPVVGEPAEMPGPLHPVQERATEPADKPELMPLPSLDQSDAYFKLEIIGIFGASIDQMLAESAMIERVVATIDNLPRPHIAERIRPVGRIGGQFLVDGQDNSGEYTVNNANYQRYDVLVDMITVADMADIAKLYRRFYPLFQGAYADLGYPDAYFNDRLVEVIDHLLETPEISGPIELVRPHVLYEFRDADLEALSSGQKLMLRLGEEHSAKVKATLREIRAQVTTM